MGPSSKIRALREEALSGSSSRSISRARTPNPDGEENGALDINFLNIEELLAVRLESLQSLLALPDKNEHDNRDYTRSNDNKSDLQQKAIIELNKSRIQSDSTTINQIIFSLSRPRNEVSSQSRELLLAQLYKLIVTKPIVVYNEEHAGTKDYVTEANVEELLNVLYSRDFRSESEFVLLYRSIIGLLASDLQEFGDLANAQLFDTIETLLLDQTNSLITNENKSGIITGYCGLLLLIYSGTAAYGIDDKINWLFELAFGYLESAIALRRQLLTGDREYSTWFHESHDRSLVSEQEFKALSEGQLGIAAIHGCCALLTLVPRGQFLNDLLSELVPKLVEFLDDEDNVDIAKAAARFIALSYELFDYNVNEEEDAEEDEEFNYNSPYYEQEALISICNRLAKLSSKKIGKKDKQEHHSIFREAVNTIEAYTNSEKRLELYKKSPEGIEIAHTLISSTTLKLSKSRSLPINSWFLYFRLLHLKWCFGFGLHSQITENDDVRLVLKERVTEFQEKYGYEADDNFASAGWSSNAKPDVDRFGNGDKKKSNDLKKARANKVTDKLEQLSLYEAKDEPK